MTGARAQRWMAAAGAACILAGCESFATRLPAFVDAEPEPGYAYVYGRFSLVTHGSMFMQPGAAGVAELVVKCEGGTQFPIAFLEDDSVQLLKLKPARCALAEMVFKNAIGYTLQSGATRIADVQFDFAAGKAHYVGDWDVDIDRTQRFGKIYSKMRWKVSDGYEQSTRKLKGAYPRFASFATEDRFRPGRDDPFVNCTSKGERIWTYRSRCD